MANSPLIGDGAFGWPVVPLGKQPPEDAPAGHGSGAAATTTRTLATGPGFFTAMQIPLLAGREFDARDRMASPPVAIVSEAWAKVNLDGRDPIGEHIVGAERRHIRHLVLAEGFRLIAGGVVAGTAAALLLSHVLASFLFGVGAADPATFVGVALLFGGVALLACWVPMRWAAGVDPAEALRSE